ncbi:MAG: hypothetical protein R3A45_13155 [Bdellovibrionota bacterium]
MPKKFCSIIVPHTPHHIIQRGFVYDNKRNLTHQDFETYRCLLSINASATTSNFILLFDASQLHLTDPITALGLTKLSSIPIASMQNISKATKRPKKSVAYSFLSYPMRSNHFLEIARYIERRPVALGIDHASDVPIIRVAACITAKSDQIML